MVQGHLLPEVVLGRLEPVLEVAVEVALAQPAEPGYSGLAKLLVALRNVDVAVAASGKNIAGGF